MLTAEAFWTPGLVGELGFFETLVANGLTSAGMARFLLRSHRMCAHGEKLFGVSDVESPAPQPL